MADDLKNAGWFGMIVCATRCYACQFGECPGVPHTWGDPEDFAHAWATFQDAPGYCGCSCGRPQRLKPKVRVRRMRAGDAITPFPMWLVDCPDCTSYTTFKGAEAIRFAVAHRWSEGCKHRRAQ